MKSPYSMLPSQICARAGYTPCAPVPAKPIFRPKPFEERLGASLGEQGSSAMQRAARDSFRGRWRNKSGVECGK